MSKKYQTPEIIIISFIVAVFIWRLIYTINYFW